MDVSTQKTLNPLTTESLHDLLDAQSRGVTPTVCESDITFDTELLVKHHTATPLPTPILTPSSHKTRWITASCALLLIMLSGWQGMAWLAPEQAANSAPVAHIDEAELDQIVAALYTPLSATAIETRDYQPHVVAPKPAPQKPTYPYIAYRGPYPYYPPMYYYPQYQPYTRYPRQP